MTLKARQLLENGEELGRFVYSHLTPHNTVFEKTFSTEKEAINWQEKAILSPA